MNSMNINKLFISKLVKFLIVGGVSTIINYSVFYSLFQFLAIQYLLSSILGYITGLLIGYFLNKFWTYQISQDTKTVFIHKYIVVYLVSLAASTLLLNQLVGTWNMDPRFANIFAIGLSTVMNFIGTNYIVFYEKV